MKYLIPAFITLPAFANSIQFLFILFVLLAPVWTRWVLAKETGRGRQNSESGDEIHESETEKTAVYVFKSVSALSDPHSPTHHPMMTPRNTEIRYLSRYFIQRTKLNKLSVSESEKQRKNEYHHHSHDDLKRKTYLYEIHECILACRQNESIRRS